MRAFSRICLTAMLAVAALLAGHPTAAHAGDWVEVGCQFADAPSAGWTAFAVGPTDRVVAHAGGCPLIAVISPLSELGYAAVLQYTPPAGSTLAGGTLDLTDTTIPQDYPTYAGWEEVVATIGPTWVAGLNPPGAFLFDNSSTVRTHTFSTEFNNPSEGGDLFITAQCTGFGSCGPFEQTTPGAQLNLAEMLLSTSAQPTAAAFSGGLLKPHADGTVGLLFTASDGDGPGVYQVQVLIDGKTIYRATPNTNDGECVPVGRYPASGSLMFDYPQPCPPSETVDVSVPTARFHKGVHRLKVIVTDAALTSATVLDTPITLSSTTTPAPQRGLHAQFVFAWTLVGTKTLLRGVTAERLLHRARVAVRCVGHGCPRGSLGEAPAAHVSRLLHRLDGLVLPAGVRLIVTVTAPGRRAERTELLIRSRQRPVGKLLSKRR